ncbi:hypothetical protein Rsub_09104 [Raphidocelis subcapitata]|uniref:Apple domain-containing protein n=1 Tax=Raphidocelis subcapitata TaxID=307507 RepID=A0A2V0P9R5_9CHLO|nr:hypothetical protein Rsub_09104 [Raphidocelis subcapitata]|eukprot:GBF96309.1 hypothetical protein Rsub_09104 [Raphidocelis subcapitata]
MSWPHAADSPLPDPPVKLSRPSRLHCRRSHVFAALLLVAVCAGAARARELQDAAGAAAPDPKKENPSFKYYYTTSLYPLNEKNEASSEMLEFDKPEFMHKCARLCDEFSGGPCEGWSFCWSNAMCRLYARVQLPKPGDEWEAKMYFPKCVSGVRRTTPERRQRPLHEVRPSCDDGDGSGEELCYSFVDPSTKKRREGCAGRAPADGKERRAAVNGAAATWMAADDYVFWWPKGKDGQKAVLNHDPRGGQGVLAEFDCSRH